MYPLVCTASWPSAGPQSCSSKNSSLGYLLRPGLKPLRDRNISAVHPIAPDSVSRLLPYPLAFCVAEIEAGSVVLGDFVPHGNAQHSDARFAAENPHQTGSTSTGIPLLLTSPIVLRTRSSSDSLPAVQWPSAHRFQRVVGMTCRISHLGHAIDICACAESPTPPMSRSVPAVPSTPDPDAA